MSEPRNCMLFGLRGDDSKAAAQRIEALFGISMTLSSRNAYFWYGEQHEKIDIEYNEDEDEDGKYFLNPGFPEFPLIVEVTGVADQDAYEKAIVGDPELEATRLTRLIFKDGPRGEVIRENYGPNGEVTVTRFLHGERTTDEPD